MTTTALTLTRVDLHQLVKPVIPLAGRDDMLPVLTCLHFTTAGTHLRAAATDRFRVGMARHEVTAPHELTGKPVPVMVGDDDVDAVVPVAHVKQALSLFPATVRLRSLPIDLTFGERSLTIATPYDDGLELRVPYLKGAAFPKLDTIIRDALARVVEAPRVTGFNPTFLADFRHAVGRGQSLLVGPSNGTTGVAVATADGRFVGVIMPRRDLDEATGVPSSPASLADMAADWFPTKTAEKAA